MFRIAFLALLLFLGTINAEAASPFHGPRNGYGSDNHPSRSDMMRHGEDFRHPRQGDFVEDRHRDYDKRKYDERYNRSQHDKDMYRKDQHWDRNDNGRHGDRRHGSPHDRGKGRYDKHWR